MRSRNAECTPRVATPLFTQCQLRIMAEEFYDQMLQRYDMDSAQQLTHQFIQRFSPNARVKLVTTLEVKFS